MDNADVLALFLVTAGVVFVLRPLVGAMAKRIAGEHRRPDPEQATDDLRTELQQVRQDVAELAERLDFAERLLAKQRESGRLAGG